MFLILQVIEKPLHFFGDSIGEGEPLDVVLSCIFLWADSFNQYGTWIKECT